MEKTDQGVLDLSKEIVLTADNAEQIVNELLTMLKGKLFVVVTHIACLGMRIEVEPQEKLLKANGKSPIRVERCDDGSTKIIAVRTKTITIKSEDNGSAKTVETKSTVEHVFSTRLIGDVPDWEYKNAHFLFSSDQVRIVFRNSKEEKVYLIFAPESGKAMME